MHENEPAPSKLHVVIVANGIISDEERARTTAAGADRLFCADGGASYTLRWGLRPHKVIGDLDSLSPSDIEQLDAASVTVEKHPSRKEATDLELAVDRALAEGATEITILGALGGRLDHTLANILLLGGPAHARVPICVADGADRLWLIRDVISLRGRPGDIVSLIPLSPRVRGVHTVGLEYPLMGDSLFLGPSRGVSNVMLAELATITIDEGLLLVIHRESRQTAE